MAPWSGRSSRQKLATKLLHPRVLTSNSSKPEQYCYRQLKNSGDIRLLNLRPGTDGDPLRGRLIVLNLDRIQRKKITYEAVSYVWGCPNLSEKIQTPEGDIAVTNSLFLALRRLRHPHQYRLLWADAICIYLDRHRTKYRGNLRLGPLFSEGFRFALVGSIHRFLSIPPSRRLAYSLSRSTYPCL